MAFSEQTVSGMWTREPLGSISNWDRAQQTTVNLGVLECKPWATNPRTPNRDHNSREGQTKHNMPVSPRKQISTLLHFADNERRLAVKCKQLNAELMGAGARVAAVLRLSEEDQTTIAALRKELEKNWKQIDASHDKVFPLPPSPLPVGDLIGT